MSRVICIFLDSIVDLDNPSSINQTRIAQLKSDLDSSDEIFIYATDKHTKYNRLYLELLETGLIPKRLSNKRIIVYPPKIEMRKFALSKHKSYLKSKADAGDMVIIVGEFLDEWSAWLQDYNFTLVGWPYNSTQTLSQLFFEQLSIESEGVTVKTNKDYELGNTVSTFFPTKSVNKRSIPAYCPEIEELLKSIAGLESKIENVTQAIMVLEEEQLSLQRQMISSEKIQTLLLKESLAHFPWLLADIGIAVVIVGIEIFKSVCKCYKKCTDSKKVCTERDADVSVQAQTRGVLSSSSTNVESSTGVLASNDEKVPFKNFANVKRKHCSASIKGAKPRFSKNKKQYTALFDDHSSGLEPNERSESNESYQQFAA